jgi:hypothetical protein
LVLITPSLQPGRTVRQYFRGWVTIPMGYDLCSQ